MTALILKYWNAVRARGDEPRPVYGIMNLSTAALVGWSLSRREAAKSAERIGDCFVVRMEPA